MSQAGADRAAGRGAMTSCAEDRAALAPRGLWFNRRPHGVAQSTGAFVWLAFILFPAVNAVAKRETALHHALTIAAAAAFVASYVALVWFWRVRYADPALPVLFAVLVAIACGLTLADASSWGFLFTYCAASAGMVFRRSGFAAIVGCCALAGVTSAIGGANGGQVISWVASSAGIGMLVMVMRDLRVRNDELSEARAELARMAVAEERERFARDLHDLLGHSLSVIALKAELAGRMLTDHPEKAATEIAELEGVARTALGEVREAVSGYRQPTLEGELAGARMALSAAGVVADVRESGVPLAPEVEAVLAWAVREGATNVIRHSRARHCALRITTSLTDAGVEVIDDGVGDADRPNGTGRSGVSGGTGDGSGGGTRLSCENGATRHAATGGHGLAGLAERAEFLNGTVEAGALVGGGYRLAVTVPVTRA